MLSIILGLSQHLPPPEVIPSHPSDSARALFSYLLWAWGDIERFCSDVAFVLILPEEAIAEEQVYRLVVVWVQPYQAHLPTLDEAARKLSLFFSITNWSYAFVKFNGDAHHVPLPREGHLNAMINGTPSNIGWRHLHWLEVHQLLQLETQVVYPEGLNGCMVLVETSLPESLVQGTNVPCNEPIFLQVDLSQFTAEDHESKAPVARRTSTSTPPDISLWHNSPKWKATSA